MWQAKKCSVKQIVILLQLFGLFSTSSTESIEFPLTQTELRKLYGQGI